ncbi:MAG: helix-hairpin-helix domain-containing protein [Sulfuricurvum sp.]|nr:helix-hairpin-helix domain-containing protein [Sulfuricurvum sp.]
MNPVKVIREKVSKLTDLPNIGKTVAADLKSIGIVTPEQLAGQDPYELYVRFCEAFGEVQDPCMLDVLMSITDFMDGGEPRVWWDYTAERKRRYASKIKISKGDYCSNSIS